MAKKFDTNPLEPDFPEKARAKAAATSPQTPYKTAEFPTALSSVTEEETRKFGEEDFQAYWHNGQQTATLYQPPLTIGMDVASDRNVPKVGMPEKWLIGLPYIPFYIGLVAGIVLLLVVPKEENKVRFHAAQGLAAHVGILIVTTILGLVGNVAGIANFGSLIFTIVTTVMLIAFAIKAWKGKPVHIETVDDLTNWLEEKIGPIKS